MVSDLKAQIDWLCRLVAIDTTSSKSNLELIDTIEGFLSSFGISSHRVYNADRTKANIYAVIGPNSEGGVVLSGHTDVVPVIGQNWQTDPFKVELREGKLFGRGTADMKSFCAIALSLVPEMLSANLTRPIVLAFSYDEEVGCLGAPAMIEEIRHSLPSLAAVVVGEPTNMKVVVGTKGSTVIKTTVTGYEAHSSQSNRGVSAVMAAGELIHIINNLSNQLIVESNSNSKFDPPHSTVCVNVIEGGSQANIMAGSCEFHWNVRALPDESVDDILSRVGFYAGKIEAEMRMRSKQCRIQSEVLSNAPPFMPCDYSAAIELACAITNQSQHHVVAYAAEAGQFQQAGFSTVICGPGSIDQAHQPNEYITIDQVRHGTDFVRRLIRRSSR